MTAPAPATDPLWAYNTSGWTNQGNTGDAETSASGNATNVLAPYDANLNGVLAQTFDSANTVTSGLATMSTNVFYASLIYLSAPAITAKFFINATTGGTTTHGYVALLTPAGTTVAASADFTNTAPTSATAWAASATIASGYYYLGVAVTTSGSPTFAGIPVLGVTTANCTGAVYASTGPFPKFVTSSSTITITSAFPATVTLAAQTTLGAAYIAIF